MPTTFDFIEDAAPAPEATEFDFQPDAAPLVRAPLPTLPAEGQQILQGIAEKPLVNIPPDVFTPPWSQMVGGTLGESFKAIGEETAGAVSGLTSPLNLSLIAATKAYPPLGLGIAASMVPQVLEGAKETWRGITAGDIPETVRGATKTAITGGMALLGGLAPFHAKLLPRATAEALKEAPPTVAKAPEPTPVTPVEPKPTPLTREEQAAARADLAAELGEETTAPKAPERAPELFPTPEEWEQLMKPDVRRDLREEGVTPENVEALLSGKKTPEQVVEEQLGVKRTKTGTDADTMIVEENPDGSRSIGFSPKAGPASTTPVNVGQMSHTQAIELAMEQGVERINRVLLQRPEPSLAPEPPAIRAQAKAPEPTPPTKAEAPAAKPLLEKTVPQAFTTGGGKQAADVVAEAQRIRGESQTTGKERLSALSESDLQTMPIEDLDRLLADVTNGPGNFQNTMNWKKPDFIKALLREKPAAKPAAETGKETPLVGLPKTERTPRTFDEAVRSRLNVGYTKPTARSAALIDEYIEFSEGHPGSGSLMPWSIRLTPEGMRLAGRDNPYITKANDLHAVANAITEAKAKSSQASPPVAAAAKVEQQVKAVAKTEGQRSAKEVKSELVSRLEKAIEEAPAESEVQAKSYTMANMKRVETPDQAEIVTIEIPGDGTFKIRNTKEALAEILKRAKRVGTSATASRTMGEVAKEKLTPDLAAKQAVQIYGEPRAAIASLERQLASQQEIDPGTRMLTERAIELLRDELPEVKLDKEISETSKSIEEKQTAIKIAEERMRVRRQMSSTRTAMKDQRFAEEQQVEINQARQSISENQKKLARLQRERATFGKPPETPPTGPGVPTQPTSPEARLSQSLQSVPKQKPPSQGPAAQPLGVTPFPGLVTGLQKVAQSAGRLWHEISDIPKFNPFKRVINQFAGDTQRTSLKIIKMQSDIESRVPEPARREAITDWLQADGDVPTLQAWAAASRNAKRRAGYISAQNLTPYEVQVARAIRQYYDDLFAKGNAYGIINQAKDDYVTQIWKRPLLGGPQFAQFASKLSRTFKFGLKSSFENFAEGEQAGYKPMTKDISKLLGIYVSELEKTIATREMTKNLLYETASDGNPLARVEGTAHIAEGEAGDPTGPMFVRPGALKPKGDVRYAELNHPALKNWKWISKDPESGRDVFVLGELRVHPEIRRHLANVLSSSQISKWMREPSESELANILKLAARAGDTTSKVVKQTMLGTLSMFHHVQEGTHAVGHRANAFLPEKLSFESTNPKNALFNYALDHGLQVAGDRVALENFREGLGAHGLFEKVPVIGKLIEKHNDLLFNEYIPRLKWDTWQRIYARNLKRYQSQIARGEVTQDDVAYLSSKQTNAAFGHQNYTDLGRNATAQHIFRLFGLAPDFLEARTRFAGQALQGVLSKVGREQLEALSVLGGLFFVGSRVLNKLSDDDWHWEEPFRVKYGNRWYGMRSVPEDIWRAFKDTRMFAYNRLNPIFGRPLMELMSGVNYRGEKIPASEVFKNALVSGIPIQMREAPLFRRLTETQRNTTITAWEQFLSSMGIAVSRYSPLNQTYKLATQWRKDHGEKEAPTTYPVSKYQPMRYALEDYDLSKSADELEKLTEGGKVPLVKIAQGFRTSLHRPFSGSLANEAKFVASLNADQKRFYREAVAQRSRVWRQFIAAEREYHRRQKEGR